MPNGHHTSQHLPALLSLPWHLAPPKHNCWALFPQLPCKSARVGSTISTGTQCAGPKEHLQDKEAGTTIKGAGASLCYRLCNYTTAGPGLSPVNRQEIRQKQAVIYFNQNLMRCLHLGPLPLHFVLHPFIFMLFRPPLCLHVDAGDNFSVGFVFLFSYYLHEKTTTILPIMNWAHT